MKNFKTIFILLLVVFAGLISGANLVDEKSRESLPSFMKNNVLSLGLDLKGGAYILLELDDKVLLEEKLENLKGEVRSVLVTSDDAKEKGRIRYKNLRVANNKVALTIRDEDMYDEAKSRIRGIDVLSVEIEENGNHLMVDFSEKAKEQAVRDAIESSMEIIRKRIDGVGTREASIQVQGKNRLIVELPGVDNPEEVKDLIGKTAKMTFHLVNEELLSSGWDTLPLDTFTVPMSDNPGRSLPIYKKVSVSGENLTYAGVAYNQDGMPVVSTKFDSLGARHFAKLTSDNVGKMFAVVLDGRIISAPVINEPILGGQGQISGGFTAETARELATLLQSGALPAPLVVVEERTIGAGLGADSIKAGKFASILGLILVVIAMIAIYGLFGLFADIVLICNMLFIFALLGFMGSTLTLPGIAGIVLTIGMAVDANVLIFERIREEVVNGLSPIRAIEEAFSKALSTILDANITTFIAAIVLFQFGSGPVKGFAVTLAVGILTTLFSTLFIGKYIIRIWEKSSARKIPFVKNENEK